MIRYLLINHSRVLTILLFVAAMAFVKYFGAGYVVDHFGALGAAVVIGIAFVVAIWLERPTGSQPDFEEPQVPAKLQRRDGPFD